MKSRLNNDKTGFIHVGAANIFPEKERPMTLSDFSTELLAAEVERRKQAEELASIPKFVAEPDLTRLRKVCAEYISELYKHGRVDSDMKQYIFEEAMTDLYGKDVFDWINAHSP